MTGPSAAGRSAPGPTDAAVVRMTGAWLADAVAPAPDDAWARPAGSLRWSCYRTVGHLLDDLLAYALQLTGAHTGLGARDDYLPVVAPRGRGDLVAVDPLELLVHGYDILSGLGLPAGPPPAASARTVARIFPDAPHGDPVGVLVWSAGRSSLTLPDGTSLPRRSRWRPDASVRDRPGPTG